MSRINGLPDEIIEAILIKLPLWDAFRSSVLSRCWRYKSIDLPHLIFDWDNFPIFKTQRVYDREIVKIVRKVLLLHQGSAHKLKFSMDLTRNSEEAESWILFASRKDVRELILDNTNHKPKFGNYNLPLCLFSCKQIIYLELRRCNFKPPALFDGFSSLKTLAFKYVDIEGEFEKFISHCPLLSKLTLVYVKGYTRLKLCNPSLVELSVTDIEFKRFIFEKTPNLTVASISFLNNGENKSICQLMNILGSVPSIRRLQLKGNNMEIASEGHLSLMVGKSQITNLTFHIDFEDMEEMSGAMCIFRSALNLRKVDILVRPLKNQKNWEVQSFEDFWKSQEDCNGMFSQLQTVNVMDFTGSITQFKFIEFILAKAPVLELVHIKLKSKKSADEMDTLRKTNRFQRISSKVEIQISRCRKRLAFELSTFLLWTEGI